LQDLYSRTLKDFLDFTIVFAAVFAATAQGGEKNNCRPLLAQAHKRFEKFA